MLYFLWTKDINGKVKLKDKYQLTYFQEHNLQ